MRDETVLVMEKVQTLVGWLMNECLSRSYDGTEHERHKEERKKILFTIVMVARRSEVPCQPLVGK